MLAYISLRSLMVLVTAFVATALSSMSGGGASVINIPVLLSLGVPFPIATATQKLSSAFWVLPAACNYLRGRKLNWAFVLLFAFVGLFGSYLGVVFVISFNTRLMQQLIGALIIALVIYTHFKKDVGINETVVLSKFRKLITYPAALLLGFYESIFGAGNGILFSAVAIYGRGFDFINALGYYYVVAFFWVCFAATLLIAKGYYDTSVMVPAVIGSIIGGYTGSRYARYKGSRFLKLVFVIIGGLLGLKLVLGL